MVKGVGIGMCVKAVRGKIVICCRFSDVHFLELMIRDKIREECIVDLGANGAKRHEQR